MLCIGCKVGLPEYPLKYKCQADFESRLQWNCLITEEAELLQMDRIDGKMVVREVCMVRSAIQGNEDNVKLLSIGFWKSSVWGMHMPIT